MEPIQFTYILTSNTNTNTFILNVVNQQTELLPTKLKNVA